MFFFPSPYNPIGSLLIGYLGEGTEARFRFNLTLEPEPLDRKSKTEMKRDEEHFYQRNNQDRLVAALVSSFLI